MVGHPKYNVRTLRTKVQVKPYGHPSWSISRGDADMIATWVTERELGHRASHSAWKLNGQPEVLLFKLHWGNYAE
jgi:hypothetical protein